MALRPPVALPGDRETQINTLPVGLLSFLGLKQFGRSPDHLERNVGGVFQIDEFYRATQLTRVVSSIGPFVPANNGLFATDAVRLVVPAGQAWLLLGFGATINGAGAGEVIELAPAIGYPNATPGSFDQELIGSQQSFNGVAAVTSPIIGSDQVARGRIITAGNALGFHLSRMGASITLVYCAVYCPLVI